MLGISVKKFIVDECVSADVAFDEEADGEVKYFLEDEGYEEGKVNVFEGDEKDVHEINEIKE